MLIRSRRPPGDQQLPPSFWYLWLGTLINRLGSFVLPFLTLFLTSGLGYEPAQAAMVVGGYGGGMLAASLIGGVLADRIGRRATIILSMGGGACVMAVVPVVEGFPALMASVVVLGLLSDLYRPAVAAAVADLVPDEGRTRAFALIYWATNLGFAVAPVVAGIVASYSFRLLFLVDAATMALYAVVVALRVPETRPVEAPSTGRDPARWREAFGDHRLLALTGLYLILASIFYQGFTTLPLSMAADGLGARKYGTTIALNGVLIVLLTLAAVPVLRKYRPSYVMAWAAVLTGGGFGLTAFATSTPGFAVAIVVWTIGEIAMAPTAPTLVARLSPPRLRGAYQGIFHVGWGGGALLGPTLGGYLFQHAGEAVLWSACAAAGLVAATGFVALGRHLGAMPPEARVAGTDVANPAAVK